jgi:hypothetical protein
MNHIFYFSEFDLFDFFIRFVFNHIIYRILKQIKAENQKNNLFNFNKDNELRKLSSINNDMIIKSTIII